MKQGFTRQMKPGFRVSLETGFHVPEAPYFKGFRGLSEVHALLTQNYRGRRSHCLLLQTVDMNNVLELCGFIAGSIKIPYSKVTFGRN